LEILNIGQFATVPLAVDDQRQASGWQEAAAGPVAQDAAQVALTIDRVRLVQDQNVASPVTGTVDLQEALTLIRQMREQISCMNRDDKNQVHQFERLRDVCFRLHQTAE
jgi:hypothetical protein